VRSLEGAITCAPKRLDSRRVGGTESVAIGDFMMRERNSRNKFVEQRKETPPFKSVIEIRPSGAFHSEPTCPVDVPIDELK
jgi:hypothetical protein